MVTDGLGTWFPREYNLLETEIAERFFEPRVGGRVFDRGSCASSSPRGGWPGCLQLYAAQVAA